MGPLHLGFGGVITEIGIFQTICLLSTMAKNMGLEAKFKSLEDSEQNLQFHSLKSSLASYSPSTLFLTFRWVWETCHMSHVILNMSLDMSCIVQSMMLAK